MLIAYLDRYVLTADAVEAVSDEIRSIIEAQLPSREADALKLEEELRQVKAEQRRLTKAVALADDVGLDPIWWTPRRRRQWAST